MKMICVKWTIVKTGRIIVLRYIGLFVGLGCYAIGSDIYEGNTYEGQTLILFIENISQ